MITQMKARNFKSWEDTGDIRMAPLTAFFGTNSSGKTALLQILLVLKQTVESADRSRTLHTGDDKTPVDIGTFQDAVFQHSAPGEVTFSVRWNFAKPMSIKDPENPKQTLFSVRDLTLETSIMGTADSVAVSQFAYRFDECEFGMERERAEEDEYRLTSKGYEFRRRVGRPSTLARPVKCYGFPDQVYADYQNAGFLSELVLAYEALFRNVYYLGPLREYPRRLYLWSGEQPQDVGRRGELAVPALLAAARRGPTISTGKGVKKQTVEERVAEWLNALGLIESFSLQRLGEGRKDYEVLVQRSPAASQVRITDVGFGVSQILPVLVLCYYVPEGATIILEHPEIHLHPSAQAGLADVFIDAIKTRHVQIILESHSEHLLRRLQRRIAEEQIEADQTALYFVATKNGASELTPLQMDLFGNIANWPAGFFGDEMGDLVAMTEAEVRRRQAQEARSAL